MEMRVILRASVGIVLVACRETWMIGPLQFLARKPTSGFFEKVRKGAGELIHGMFNDYCLGIEL